MTSGRSLSEADGTRARPGREWDVKKPSSDHVGPLLKALMGLHRTWNNFRNPPHDLKGPRDLSVPCPSLRCHFPFTTCSLLSVPQTHTLLLFWDLCIGCSLAGNALIQIFLGLSHISGVTSPESSSRRNLEDTSPSPKPLSPFCHTILFSFFTVCIGSLYQQSVYLSLFIFPAMIFKLLHCVRNRLSTPKTMLSMGSMNAID